MTTGQLLARGRCGAMRNARAVRVYPAELAKRDIISPLTGRQRLSTAIFYARSSGIGITAF